MSYLNDLDYWELIGLVGAVIYCSTYLLTAFDVVTSNRPSYYALKFAAAALVAFSLTHHFNVASLMIQLFFMVVSVVGFFNHLRRRHRQPMVLGRPIISERTS